MRQCELCGKGSIMRGQRIKLRGNYNPTDKKRKYPNLQSTKVLGRGVTVCTQCLRSVKKIVTQA